jgi:hypothetical protein
MTISAADPARKRYVGDGSTTTFAIGFSFDANDEVAVYVTDDTSDPDHPAEMLQTYTTHYTIVGSNVVFGTAPALNRKVTIMADYDIEQDMSLSENVSVSMTTLMDKFDDVVSIQKQQQEQIDRSLKFMKTSPVALETGARNPVISEFTADGILKLNTAKTALETVTVAELGILASEVEYSGSGVDVAIGDLQDQIDDVVTDVATKASQASLDAHIADASAAHIASAVGVTPAGTMGSTDVQAALVEILGDVEAHVADATAAHAASAVSFAPTGNTSSTTVQAAIVELQGDINAITAGAATSADNVSYDDTASGSGMADVQAAVDDLYANVVSVSTDIATHTNGGAGKHQASEIDNTPSGNLAATTVQGALNELQSDIDSKVDDTVYGAGWNADTTHAPSKNAVYDKIEAVVATIPTVSDTAYAGSWDGVTAVAPSKNAVYDKIEAVIATIPTVSDTAYAASWDGVTTIAPSKNAVYDKVETVQTAVDGLNTFSSHYLQNLGLACSVASNALTINLKQADGSTAPAAGSGAVKIAFRNTTITTGAYNVRSVTGALSVVVSSGSTLGHTSAKEHFIWVYAIDNAGTVELAVSTTKLDVAALYTTTAEGGAGAADSGRTLYSTTARSNVPIRLIGRLRSTQTTAGTWAAVPTEVICDPAQLTLALDPILARYTHSTTMAVSGANHFYPDTKEIDTHGSVVTGSGTWVFTAARAGYFRITTVWNGAAAVSQTGNMYCNTTGTGATPSHYISGLINNSLYVVGATVIYLPAGGTVWLDNATTPATNLANAPTGNWIVIESIG